MSSGVQKLRAFYMTPDERGREDREDEEGGLKCCYGLCRIGTCSSPKDFYKNPHGVIKAFEAALSLVSQVFLLNYGVKYAPGIGLTYYLTLWITSGSFLVTSVLGAIFFTSHQSKIHIKSSLFELIYNFALCGLFLVISVLFMWNVHSHLIFYFNSIPGFGAYPKLLIAGLLGFIAGLSHGIDGFMALRDYRKYNN